MFRHIKNLFFALILFAVLTPTPSYGSARNNAKTEKEAFVDLQMHLLAKAVLPLYATFIAEKRTGFTKADYLTMLEVIKSLGSHDKFKSLIGAFKVNESAFNSLMRNNQFIEELQKFSNDGSIKAQQYFLGLMSDMFSFTGISKPTDSPRVNLLISLCAAEVAQAIWIQKDDPKKHIMGINEFLMYTLRYVEDPKPFEEILKLPSTNTLRLQMVDPTTNLHIGFTDTLPHLELGKRFEIHCKPGFRFSKPTQEQMQKEVERQYECLNKYFTNNCCVGCINKPVTLENITVLNNPVKLLNCGRCKRVKYCSPDCQKGHWSIHKSTCKPAQSDAGSSSKSASKPADSKEGKVETKEDKSKKKKSSLTSSSDSNTLSSSSSASSTSDKSAK